MFNWQDLEDLKKLAFERDDYQAAIAYQNEQILRELKSIGWKLKEMTNGNVQSR